MLLQGITQLGSRAAVNDIAPSPLLAEVAHRLKQRGEGPSMKGVQQLQLFRLHKGKQRPQPENLCKTC